MGRWLILYDAECGFCKWVLAQLLRWDRGLQLQPLAIQSDQAAVLLADLTAEQRLASWHLVATDGTRESAGLAIPSLLRLLPGGSLPAAALARHPELTERVYGWIATHRGQISRWIPSASKRRAEAAVAARVTRV